jgi:hypothetical protein
LKRFRQDRGLGGGPSGGGSTSTTEMSSMSLSLALVALVADSAAEDIVTSLQLL